MRFSLSLSLSLSLSAILYAFSQFLIALPLLYSQIPSYSFSLYFSSNNTSVFLHHYIFLSIHYHCSLFLSSTVFSLFRFPLSINKSLTILTSISLLHFLLTIHKSLSLLSISHFHCHFSIRIHSLLHFIPLTIHKSLSLLSISLPLSFSIRIINYGFSLFNTCISINISTLHFYFLFTIHKNYHSIFINYGFSLFFTLNYTYYLLFINHYHCSNSFPVTSLFIHGFLYLTLAFSFSS
ncbi:unnamed protein product [Acanthosepion pharaonis]|uniref:Uncharacterized protein n=1 Tax=Acanthosepion pharaonis TaxID=158019 RepID=A0A812C6Q6_ACAPH|nr:unnamed protein product [Sepia pharaonis]